MKAAPSVPDILGSLFLLGICLGAGDLVNRLLFSEGVMLPGFLTAMMVGILITYFADLFKIQDRLGSGRSGR